MFYMFEPLTEEETEQLEALDECRQERLARIEAYCNPAGPLDVPQSVIMQHMEDERDEETWVRLHHKARTHFLHTQKEGRL